MSIALCVVLTPATAEAHAFAQRYDLPLPLGYYLTGAGAAVAVTFAIAVLFLRKGHWAAGELHFSLSPLATRTATATLRTLGLCVFALLVLAGLFGEQGDWDSNILPVTAWIIWWVGFAFVSALFGNLWPLLDPWRTIGTWFGRKPLLVWPKRLGAWPAVALFFAFACAELAWTQNAVPFKLAMLILAYSLLTWAGMGIFGVASWRKNADPFTRFFDLFARFAPFDANGGNLIVRLFGAGLVRRDMPTAATTAFIILMLSTVTFDGLSDTPLWDSIVGEAMRWLYDTKAVQLIGYTSAGSLIKIIGLATVPILFAAAYLLVCALAGYIAGSTIGTTARRYIFTLVPIAIAYHLAHYLAYLLVQGQAIIPLLSDPLNLGWNLFGTRGHEIDIGVVDMKFIWLFAVGAIVTGHVAAVLLAHVEAIQTEIPYLSARRALIAQFPMLVFMVVYTMLSLWILSQPIVAV